MLHSIFIISLFAAAASAALSESSLEIHVGALSLSASFNPIKESYWTGYPHHRRTPFAVSPDGKSAYLAYLDASETDVHVQQVDPSTFAAVGDAVSVTGGKEAGGLVAHDDGFALLTNEAMPSGTSNAPPDNTPVPVLYRFTSGEQTWRTWLGGPGVHESMGLAASPDLNGDLVYSEAAKTYGAYFVITAYTGDASGHFGDNIQYVNDDGTREDITGATSSGFGCSHNTGIAFEAADEAPFASICAEDQGAVWLNTKTQYMDGVKISNENVTNGASNEAMGGMSGSYSGLARFIDSDSYIFTWVSRGAKDLTTNDWLGTPYTHAINRTVNRNVAIAQFSDKNTLVGDEATSELVADGDSQVNWITTGTADCSNAHVAAFDGTNALVTWEEIAEPSCPFLSMGCKGAFTGSYFQLVNNGEKVGEPLKRMDVFVAGDMVTMSDGRICWPYVDMDWTLDGPVMNPASVTKMSFACMNLDGSGNSSTAVSSSAAAASSTGAASSVAQSSVQASLSSIEEVDVSTAAPVTGQNPTATAQVPSGSVSTPTPAPQPEASDSALPSFVLVSSGASISLPVSSAPVASTSASEIPSEPSGAPVLPSGPQTPEVSAVPSAPSTLYSIPDTLPTTAPEPPSDTDVPAFPSGTGSGMPPFPFPSGVASPSGFDGHHHHHSHHRPSGGFGYAWPTGFGGPRHGVFPEAFGARPTGGFGSGFGRGPSGSQLGTGRTPCTFETRIRPTATPVGQ